MKKIEADIYAFFLLYINVHAANLYDFDKYHSYRKIKLNEKKHPAWCFFLKLLAPSILCLCAQDDKTVIPNSEILIPNLNRASRLFFKRESQFAKRCAEILVLQVVFFDACEQPVTAAYRNFKELCHAEVELC